MKKMAQRLQIAGIVCSLGLLVAPATRAVIPARTIPGFRTVSALSEGEALYEVRTLRIEKVNIELTFAHASGDLDLEVLNEARDTVLTTADTATDNETIEDLELAAGTYFIRVHGDDNSYTLGVTPGTTSSTTVYYVNDASQADDLLTTVAGSVDNDALSPDTPMLTVQDVLSAYDLGPDSLVAIDTGIYAAPVTIVVDDEGATYAGSANGSSFTASTCFDLDNADHNTFYGLRFTGSGTGFYAHANSTNNEFLNNTFAGKPTGIYIDDGADDLLSGNVITGTGSYGIRLSQCASATIAGNTIAGPSYAVHATGTSAQRLALFVHGNTLSNGSYGVYMYTYSGGSVIRDNTITNMEDYGIYMGSGGTDNDVHDNEVSACEIGIYAYSATNVYGNTVLDCGIGVRSHVIGSSVYGNTVTGSTGHGLYGRGWFGGTNWEPGQPNTISDCGTGVFADQDSMVRYNLIRNCEYGVTLGDNVTIHHNIIARNSIRGISVYDDESVTITNNTIYAPEGDGVRVEAASTNVVLKNNIIWAKEGYCLNVATDSQVGFDSDYNCLYATDTGKLVWWQKDFVDLFDWQVEADYDNNSIGFTAIAPDLDNPRFVSVADDAPAADDFHLVGYTSRDAGSTSIDAGDPASAFADEPEPRGDRINLGAYGGSAEAAASRAAFIEVSYPNYYTDWPTATAHAILWRAHNVAGNLDIDLVDAAGAKVADITTIDAAEGAFGWSPEASGISGSTANRYRVRIASVSGDTITDQSRETFSIPPTAQEFYVNDAAIVDDEYCSVTGNNRNTGATAADPKANLLPVLRSYDLGQGDTVYIDTGDYIHVRNVLINDEPGAGDEGATFTGPVSHTATIDRANPHSYATTIDVQGDWVTVRDLTLTGGNMGIWVHNSSQNFQGDRLVLRNNTQDGIRLESDADYSTLGVLTIHHNGRYGAYIATPIGELRNGEIHDNGDDGVYLTNAGNIEVSGNTIYRNRTGVYIGGRSGSQAIVQDNTVYENAVHGIHGSYMLAQRNAVHGNDDDGIQASYNCLVSGNVCHSNGSIGIRLYSGNEAVGNVVHNNAGSGILAENGDVIRENRCYANGGTAGIVAYRDSEITGNVVYSNVTGIYGYGSSSPRFRGRVANNLIYDNAEFGIQIRYAHSSSGLHARVVNNTVHQGVGDAVYVHTSSEDVDLRNNILWVEDGACIRVSSTSQVGFSSDHNLFHTVGAGIVANWQGSDRATLTAWQNTAFRDGNSVQGDPLFVDLPGRDFHLKSEHGSLHDGSLAPVLSGDTGMPVDASGTWVDNDGVTSLAIDLGDPSDRFDREPEHSGNFINLGAYGNTVQASKSPEQYVRVLSPDGAEVWPAGQPFSIRWRSHDFAGLGQAYAAAVAADSPTGYWRLDETTGSTAADSSGSSFHGTYAGSVALNVPGISQDNGAARFNGQDASVTVPHDAALTPATITVEASLNLEAGMPNYALAVGKTSSTNYNNGYGIYYTNDGYINFFVDRDDGDSRVRARITLNRWIHVVGTFDGSKLRLYLNGELASESDFSGAFDHSSGPLRIGYGHGTHYWQGGIDDVAVYSAVLAQERIRAHLRAKHGSVSIELVDDSRATALTIATATDNDGEYLWTLPDSLTPATNYRIRIGRDDPALTDASNNNFEITAPISVYYVNDATVEQGDWCTAPGAPENDGLTPATPKDSVSAVLEAFELGPEDTVRVDNGDYDLVVNIVVTAADAGVRIQGYHDGAYPARAAVLDRGNTASGSYVFDLQNGDGIRLERLSITGGETGIHASSSSDSDDVTITNCRIYGNAEYGLWAGSGNDRLEVSACTLYGDRTSSGQEYGIQVSGDGVLISGNVVRDHYRDGINCQSDQVIVGNTVSDNQGTGIECTTSFTGTIRENTVTGSGLRGIYGTGSSSDWCRVEDNTVSGSGDDGIYAHHDCLVSGNISHSNGAVGVELYSGNEAVGNVVYANVGSGIWASLTNVIRENRCYDNAGTAGIVMQRSGVITGNVVYSNVTGIYGRGDSTNSTFRGHVANNLVYDNSDFGIQIRYAGASSSGHARLVNNTVYQEVGDAIYVHTSSKGVELRSSILWVEDGACVRVSGTSQVGFSSDYNTLYTTGAGILGRWDTFEFTTRADWFYQLGLDGHSRTGDPLFVDPDNNDFHLQSTSPAIDSGDLQSYYLAEPWPHGGRANQGAHGNTDEAALSPERMLQVLSPNGLEKVEKDQEVAVTFRGAGLLDSQATARINVGGTTYEQWLYDWYREGGSASTLADVDTAGVTDAAPDEIYRTYAYPSGTGTVMRYALSVADGDYTMRLHLLSGRSATSGYRIDIRVQDELVAEDFITYVAAGSVSYKALVLSYDVSASAGQGVTVEIQNTGGSQDGKLCGVELSRDISGSRAGPTVDLAVSVNSGADWVSVATGLELDELGNGLHTWYASPSSGGENTALIRASMTGEGTLNDTSDEAFSIANDDGHYYVNDAETAGDLICTAAGDNANSGKSPSVPMASLRSLLAAYDLDSGDVVHVDTGTYLLTDNVVIEAEDAGVTIEGPDTGPGAVLDRGNTSSGSYVFDVQNGDGVRLERLSITGGLHGIYASSSSDSDDVTITNCRIYGNAEYGLKVDTGNDRLEVSACTLYGDRTSSAQKYGIAVKGDGALVSGNVARDHYYEGISCQSDQTIVGNTVSDNQRTGIHCTGYFSGTIRENTVTGAGLYGIYGDGSSGERCRVEGNTVSGSSNHGIYGSRYCLVSGNTCHSNGSAGIHLFSGNEAVGNVVYNNAGSGIGADRTNAIRGNRCYDNDGTAGIVAYRATEVTGNVVYSNVTGIYCHGAGATSSSFRGHVANNLIYGNTDFGIQVRSASTYSGLHARLANNTVYQEVGDAVYVHTSSKDVELRNNILWAEDGACIRVSGTSQVGFSSDYNTLYTTGAGILGRWDTFEFTTRADWFYELGLDEHSRTDDPQLVDPKGVDGKLGYVRGGLLGQYYDNEDLSGTPVLERLDGTIDFDWSYSPGGPVPADHFSVRWAGWLYVPSTDDYTFYSRADTGERLYLGGSPIIEQWAWDEGAENSSGPQSLTMGWHAIRYECHEETGSAYAQLFWGNSTLPKQIIPRQYLSPDQIREADYSLDSDFHLQSASPAIDSGDLQSYYLAEPWPHGGRANQGAYGNTDEAALSPERVLQVLSPNGLEKFEEDQEAAVTFRSAGLLGNQVTAMINVGGPTYEHWLHDWYREGGIADTRADVDTAGVMDAAPDQIYRTHAYPSGSGTVMRCALPVSDGDYTVRLHLLSGYSATSGYRIDIRVQDELVAEDFNTYVAAGSVRDRALVLSYDVSASAGQGVTVEIQNTGGSLDGKLCGVELSRNVSGSRAVPAVDLAVSVNNGADWVSAATGLGLDELGKGLHTWYASPSSGGENTALIRASLTGDEALNDTSDEAFSIAAADEHFYVNDAETAGDLICTAAGDNANSGKSPSVPMASLRSLLAAYDLDPGDVVHVDTGTYVLTDNVVIDTDDAGVAILGPETGLGAVLDRGNTASGSYVFDLQNGDGVRLERLSITGGFHGIYASSSSGSDDVTVTDCRIYGNAEYGLNVDTGNDRLEVSACTLYGDRTSSDQDYGIGVQGDGALISGNVVRDHYYDGINCQSDQTIVGNTVSDNQGTGIECTASFTGTIRENVVTGSGGYGIYGNGNSSEWCRVEGNTVSGNSNYGIYAYTNCSVSGNICHSNGSTGIRLRSGGEAVGNVSYNNVESGIWAERTSVVRENRCYVNAGTAGIVAHRASEVTGNVVYSNVTGIYCHGDSSGSTSFRGRVANNLIYGNTDFGVQIMYATTYVGLHARLVNNTIYQEVGDAVHVHTSSQDVELRNNILWIGKGYAVHVNSDSQSGFVSDYNLLHQSDDADAYLGNWGTTVADLLADWQSVSGQGTNSLGTEPLFIDIDGADNVMGYDTTGDGYNGGGDDNFYLRGGSPAIDRADTWAAPATDILGMLRHDDPATGNGGMSDYAVTDVGANQFVEVGTAQNWRSSGNHWTLTLPFDFTFYGTIYDQVYVSTEGYLQFGSTSDANDSSNSTVELKDYARIVPLWDDLETNGVGDDIFVDESVTGQVVIRWDATNTADDSDVNVSVTLFADGQVQFDYGPGNAGLTPTVGIGSGGLWYNSLIATSHNGADVLGNVNSLRFALSQDGAIADIGAYEFQGTSDDTTPPTVVGTTPTEVHDEGNYTDDLVFAIDIEFSEGVIPIDAEATSNFELRDDGGDGTFGEANDRIFAATPDYDAETRTVTLRVDAGFLPRGRYQLTVSGDASVHDLSGIRLDGDQNGSEGGDYVRVFVIGTLADFVLADDSGVSGTDKLTRDNPPRIDVRVTGPGTIKVDWDNDGTDDFTTTVGAGGTYTYAPGAALPDGAHTIKLTFTDENQNMATFTDTITVDATPPALTVIPTVTQVRRPSLAGTVNDAEATLQVTVDGRAYSVVNQGTTWELAADTISADLVDGVYDVQVAATDVAGNVGTDPTLDELVVDNAPPLVTVGFLRTNDTTPPLSGTVNDPSATVQVTVAGVLYPGTVAGQMWSIANDTIASALGEGQHEIVAAATDRAGNTGTDSTTNELTIDLDGPHVLDLSRESSDGTGIDRLVVAFDEALDAGSATDPGNYALDLSGADTTFGNGNETAYAGTIAATYDAGPAGQGPFRVALLLSDKLTGEVYQLTVKGTTSVLDIAGNPLNDGVDEQLQFTVTTPAELQFSEDWESQSLVGPWELHTMDAGAVQLTDANVPLGNWHLVLGDAVGDGTKSLAEATLHVNLAGRENVFVSFQAKGLDGSANAYDPMSDLFNGHEQSDGIAISVDGGVTWYKVWSGQVGTDYAQQEIALDDLLAASSPDAEYSTDTLIRFQNYGDGMAGVDALFIDNIRVNDAFQDPAVTSFTLADPTETASGYTNQRQVDVALTQEADPALSITGWYLSESDSAPAADHGGWLAVMPTTHDLTGPEGAIVVYAWVKDSHDVVSAAEAATIALDKTAPSAPAVNGTTPTGDSTPEWTWTSGGGGGSGAFRQQLDAEEAAGWAETTDTAFTPTEDLSEGTHTLHVQEADAVGNWSLSGSLTITVDATAPNAPVVDGTNPTTDVTPEWTWSSGGGGGSGTFRYQLDSEEGAWVETDQLSFVPDTPFGLGETHVLHVQETDDVGLWSISGNFSIIVVAPLVVGSVTPGPAQGLGTATVVVPGEAQVDESADLAFTVNATGGVAPYHFAWTAGGVPVGGDASVLLYAPGTDAVTHPAISDNKEILCEVTDSWGVVTATATWQIVRVDDVNHVPSMTGVVGVITPSSAEQPTLHDDLLCSLSSPAQDGDLEDLPSMRYRFVWTRGDREVLREIVSWETFDELSYVETAEADEITCTVTAVDQLDVESAGAASATVTIRPPLPGSWELSIGLTNVQVDRVVIGMHERATDGWDSVWDRRTPPTAQGEGYAALEISGEKLSQDFRAIKQYDTFLLRVTSFWESECVLSWDSAAVPGVGLSLEEIGADGEPLGRAASLDMSQEDTLTVPAGHVVFYRIRYGVLRFELELASGWNMFSIPLHPVDTSVEAVLQGQNDGQVWVWDPVQRQYSFASEIVPLRGYWVFCGTQRDGGAATVTVVGRRVDERDVEVTEGWHIVGPVGEVPYAPLSLPLLTVPAGSVQDRPWTWNAELERYDQVDQLRCGRGAWIFSAGPSVIRLGE